MASELCMNCFSVKGQYEVCPFCGYVEGTPPEQPHYLTPGTILANHFIVGTAIGMGGFGITYKCYDTTLGVIVAVKEFYPVGLVNRSPGEKRVGLLSGERTKQYQEQIQRFLMEAQSIAQFGKAKDIVNVYDYFEENNTAYIIMEYIDGVLLKDYLDKQGRMEPDTAFMIIDPIIDAVKKIHAKGIIHRDISPDNIFISGNDSVKIFDFGAARLNDSTEGLAGEKVIKVGYSAPEQYRDTDKQGYFTDIYSVGAILYQMVTGVKPIESTEREFKDELKSPLELGADIDANVDRAIMEALAVQPELRFQGIQQFDDALHGKRIAEYPKDKIRKRKRKRNIIAIASFLLIALIALGIAFVNAKYEEENVMFDTKVKEDTVTIWVDSQDQKTVFEEMKEKLSTIEKDDSDAIKEMKKENKNITYNIRNISVAEEGYEQKYADMDSALEAATQGKEEFPDLFVSDNVSDIEKYDLVSYKDNVFQNIEPEEYLYLSAYKNYFSDMKEMPTSFDVLLFYAINTEKQNVTESMKAKLASRKIQSSTLLKKTSGGTIELQEILDANQKGEEHTYFDERMATQLSIFKNPESFDNKKGTFTFDGKFAETLNECLEIEKNTAKTSQWKLKEKENMLIKCGNSILAGAGERSQWYGTKIENTSIPYQVYVPTVDGKMLVSYQGKLAISAKASKNKQVAGMRFVYFAMGQQQCAVDKNTAFPISDVSFQNNAEGSKSPFEEYFTINDSQKIVRKLIKKQSYPCILIGKGTGEITDFADGIKTEQIEGTHSIEEYCKKFQTK